MKTTMSKENRGTKLNGGKVVGTKGGVVWVSYEGQNEYRRMCRLFDRQAKG